ncbi:hypothetical protein WR25_24797 [Diploscapter pachys]|uniref:Uncharacterized protein n=1 Tax=Diploscapter pachys TaxID=2018661 RepID=A0A2A2KRM6_9BILA|nr:hypothetical protein WR25_24797 [Diploscapter pachys]
MADKKVHRSEFTDLDQTFRIEVFNDEDHGGKVKTRQIGTRKQEIGEIPRFFTCIYKCVNLHTSLTGLHMLSENGNLSKVQDDLITQVILGHLPQELDFYGRESRQQQTVSLSLPLQLPVRTL